MSQTEEVDVLRTYENGNGDTWVLERRPDGICIETNVRTGYERVTHPEDFRASFDLTRVWGRDVWRDLMNMFDLELTEVDIASVTSNDTPKTILAWMGDDLLVRTTTNPLTGEKANYYPGEEDTYDPDDNLAYAGYIHLEGEEDAVREATEHIKNNSSYKDVSVGKWCV